MLDEVAIRLNFTYQLQDLTPDGMWGEMVNGTWVGMMGQLVRGEKDVIINSFAILHDRYQAITFSAPYFTDSYSASLKVQSLPKVLQYLRIKWQYIHTYIHIHVYWWKCDGNTSVLLQIPPALPRWVSVVYPFQLVVWVGVAGAVVTLGLAFHLLIRHRPHFVYTNS